MNIALGIKPDALTIDDLMASAMYLACIRQVILFTRVLSAD
jgi:hypothetical protein